LFCTPLGNNSSENTQLPIKVFSVYIKSTLAVPKIPKAQKNLNTSYNDKIMIEEEPIRPATQHIVETEETTIKADTNSGKEMYWFRWDSYD
jgi:hypothetical protein